MSRPAAASASRLTAASTSRSAAPRVAPCCSQRVALCCPTRCALLPSTPSRPAATIAAAAARATGTAGGGATRSAGSAGGAEGATGSAGGAAGAGGATGSAGGAAGAGGAGPTTDCHCLSWPLSRQLQRLGVDSGGHCLSRTTPPLSSFASGFFNEPVQVVEALVFYAAALGASESAAALGASESAAALGASGSAVALGARASPATGLHLPTFLTNLVSNVAIQDVWVDTFIPGGQRGAICTCSRTGRHLATFTRRPGSSQYTLTTASAQVAMAGQVAALSQVSASCQLAASSSMHSRLLVSGLPRSMPSLPRSPASLCLPCVEGRQRAAPHSSEFPPTTAPLQTLHMDVWGPANVGGMDQERYFLLVVDDYTHYTTVFPLHRKADVSSVLIPWIRTTRRQLRERFSHEFPFLRLHSDRGDEFSSDLLAEFCRDEGIVQSFTLPASPQKNGIAESRIGLIMEVACTSMIHADAPHFPWPFAVRYAAHQLNLWPRISEPETSPTLFLGFPTDAPPWQFYHPRSRRVFSSQDVTFDKSICYYTLHPHASYPVPLAPLFLVPVRPPVDPLPPQGPAPSCVSQVDPPPLVEPLEISSDSYGPAEGGDPAADDMAATRRSPRLETPPSFPPWPSSLPPQPAAVDSGDETPGAGDTGGTTGGAGGATGAGGTRGAAGAGGARATSPRGATGAGGAGPTSLGGTAGAGGAGGAAGAGGAGARGSGGAGGAGPGGARTGGAGAAGSGGVIRAGGATGAAGSGGTRGTASAGGAGAARAGGTAGAGGTGGTGGAGAAGPGGARTRGAGAARAGGGAGTGGAGGATGSTGSRGAGGTTGARGPGVAGASGVAGPGDVGGAAGAAGAGGAGAGGAGAAGTAPRRPFFYLQPQSSLPPPDSVLRQVLSLPSSTCLPLPLLCPPTDQSQPQLLRSSPLPVPAPHTEVTESLTERREPETRASTPVRARRVACPRPLVVPGTHGMAICPSSVPQRIVLPEPPASSLPHVPDPESDLARAAGPIITRLLTTVVTDPDLESIAAFALGTELVDFAARSRLDYVASLVTESESLCPLSVGGELALGSDRLENRQAIADEYSSQWQTAMDVEMASWKSTGTYVDEFPPSWANIVDGMWIFRVKRPPGSPPAFKVRYVARGFRQRKGFDFFQTFSPTPKMTTLRITRDRARHTITLTQSRMVHQSVEPSGPYPELVGCLMYLMTCTRPDLAYPLSLLARYVAPGRHRKQRRQLRLSCVASWANIADVFTKALGSGDHQRFCTALGLVPTLPHLLVA
ncbi:unnamed protein product [Closterium sp. NIES-53]